MSAQVSAPDWRILRELAGKDDASSLGAAQLAFADVGTWTEISRGVDRWERCRVLVQALARLSEMRDIFPTLLSPPLEAALGCQELLAAIGGELQSLVNLGKSRSDAAVLAVARQVATLVATTSLKEERCYHSIRGALRELGVEVEEWGGTGVSGGQATSPFQIVEELLGSAPRNLKANCAGAAYKTVEDYLSVHKSLFLEDFAEGLRKSLRDVARNPGVKDSEHLYAYGVATVSGLERISSEACLRVQLGRCPVDYECVEWDSSKRLLDGSLLALASPRGPRDRCAFAVVREDGRRRDLRRGVLRVRVDDLARSADFLFAGGGVLVYESRAYFEAFRLFAEALRSVEKDGIPLERYFLSPDSESRRPQFLSAELKGSRSSLAKTFQRPKSPLTAKEVYYSLMSKEEQGAKDKEDLDLVLRERTCLNESQLAAVTTSLQQEVGLVQGPPGTGKTFVGKILISTLLDNADQWRKEKGRGPILVVTQTNRSLDSLMESLLVRTDKMVRLGSRSTSPRLDGHGLASVRQFMREGMVRESVVHKAEKVLLADKARLEERTDRELSGLPESPSAPELERLSLLEKAATLASARLRELQWLEAAHLVCAGADVVGATATGAAKNRALLRAVAPRVVILEEAGLMMEAQVLSSLPPSCQQIVLIGDHQQLRPSTNSYLLTKKFNLDVSFFERLILNGHPYTRLKEQHRMRPGISRIVSNLYYPDLQDHKSVLDFPRVSGMAKSVFFMDHSFQETASVLSNSKSNLFEADFLLQLARHLLRQGYRKDEITILTTYVGQQLRFYKEIATNFQSLEGIKVQTVDNYQGEESRIILLSLVRGGGDGIGFLSESNRLCVALSRAREGLYIVGNMGTLTGAKSDLWRRLQQEMVKWECLGDALEICCFSHPERRRPVRTPDGLRREVDGGCPERCGRELDCGHSCALPCHFEDRGGHSGEEFRCRESCSKRCPHGHPCPKSCSDPCGHCPVVVAEVKAACGHPVAGVVCGLREVAASSCGAICGALMDCGHECKLPCHGDAAPHSERCPEACHRSKSGCRDEVGHPCPRLCWEPCDPCAEPVERSLSCGHEGVGMECRVDPGLVECSRRCNRDLPCGHKCRNYCYECRDGCDPCYRCNR